MNENENAVRPVEVSDNPIQIAPAELRLFGRKVIYADFKPEDMNESTITKILNDVFDIHLQNASDIEYLEKYYRGYQPIIGKTKEVRPTINNTVVENNAYFVTEFKKSYVFGEPIQYVQRGDVANPEVSTLNTRIDSLNYISNEMLAEELSSYVTLQKLTEDYLGATAINELLRLKADISTTLAGYGITDAYTKAETDQAIADKVASITGGESAAAVKMALEAEITRSTTKDTEHDNILSALNEKVKAIEEGSWENVIDAVDENDFNLENKILSLKISK